MPSRELRDGLMIVFAAALLLTPGLLTDTLGFVLLTPPGRALIGKLVVDRYAKRVNVEMASGYQAPYQNTMHHGFDSAYQEPLNRQSRSDGYTIDAEVVKRKDESH